jgi:broad specificity phosphatase PhoE
MTKLALLRHGHTHWNRAGHIQGRSDIPLDDQARADLAGFRLPPPWDRADLWSSPLKRATQTAQIVARRAPRTAPELTEMDWGDWEGRRGVDLAADPASGFRHIEDWGWDYRPGGGESPSELWARLRTWLHRLHRDTVAVCHIGVMRVFLARAHGWDFAGPAPFQVKRNRLYVLHFTGNTLTADPDPVRLIGRDGNAR